MTETLERPSEHDSDGEPPVRDADGEPAPREAHGGSADMVYRACPYLIAADGTWRGSQPTRDHRCFATQPPAPPAVAKQRDLCLTSTHVGCATFVAAQQVEAGRAPAANGPVGGFWPDTRSITLALEPGHGRSASFAGSSRKGGGQALLVGLMVLAFLVLVIARSAPQSGTGASPSAAGGIAAASASVTAAQATPSIRASGAPSASSGASPSSSGAPSASSGASPSSSAVPASASPPPSLAPAASATAKPAASSATPAAVTTYKVRSGDTLSAIAIRFATTVKKIKVANGLTSSALRTGQVLVIP